MDESTIRQVYGGYRVFPPFAEILLGVVVLACGLILAGELWEAGYVEKHVLVLGIFGLAGIGDGVWRALGKRRLDAQVCVLRQREAEILATLRQLRPDRQGGIAWLNGIGITDERLCRYLVGLAEITRDSEESKE